MTIQNKKPTNDISVRYDKSSVLYTTQFVLSPSDEEILLDFSSGLIADSTNANTLPIHTRLAMSWSAAERLARVLSDIVAQKKQRTAQHGVQRQQNGSAPHIPQATLPQMTTELS